MRGKKKPITRIKETQIEGTNDKGALNPKRKKKLVKVKTNGEKR